MTGHEIILALKSTPTDRRLWERFYLTLFPLVVQSAFRTAKGNGDLSREAAHYAFARFAEYNSLERVSSDAHALAFLRQIARRYLLDASREATHEAGALDRLKTASMPLDDATVAWMEDQAQLERRHDLLILAEGLSADDRDALGRLLDGESMENIAKHQGVSYNSLAVRLFRIRKRMAGNALGNGIGGTNSSS